MKLTFEITEAQIDDFLREAMQNMPEASLSLACFEWDYEKMKFRFDDYEDSKSYSVELPELRKGFKLMMTAMVEQKEMPGIYKEIMPDFLDSSNWDANALDCLVQYSIFGEAIYG